MTPQPFGSMGTSPSTSRNLEGDVSSMYEKRILSSSLLQVLYQITTTVKAMPAGLIHGMVGGAGERKGGLRKASVGG